MRIIQSLSAILLVTLVLLFCSVALAQSQPKQPLRVLYVSNTQPDEPGAYSKQMIHAEREADFMAFLKRNFTTAQSCKDSEFTTDLAAKFDVIVLDGDISSRVPAGFARPVVLLGGTGEPRALTEKLGRNLAYA